MFGINQPRLAACPFSRTNLADPSSSSHRVGTRNRFEPPLRSQLKSPANHFIVYRDVYRAAFRQNAPGLASNLGSANTMRHIVTNLAIHIRIGLPRGFSELAVFDARFYIRVRCIDEPA
jgi:hypothetical protein